MRPKFVSLLLFLAVAAVHGILQSYIDSTTTLWRRTPFWRSAYFGGAIKKISSTLLLLRFDPERESWTRLVKNMATRRRSAVAIPVTDEFANCF